jgi:carbonic anhydrase
VIAALLASSNAASYDYLKNGADRGIAAPACNGTNQSPINLVSKGKSGFDYPVVTKDDIVNKHYDNQANVVVAWNGHTSQVNL